MPRRTHAISHPATLALLLITALSQLGLWFSSGPPAAPPWPLMITTLLPLALCGWLWFRPQALSPLPIGAALGAGFALVWWLQGGSELPLLLLLGLVAVPIWVGTPWALAALLVPPLGVHLSLGAGQGHLLAVALPAAGILYYLARQGQRLLRSQALQQRRLRWQLQHRSHRESLTGLANRRYLHQRLEQAVSEARRSKSPLAIVLLEVDYFIEYRSRYGIQAGEVCLRQIADLLRLVSRRQSDILARYDDATFALLLPATDRAGAQRLCYQIRQGLQRLSLPNETSPIHPCVTLSQGVAQWQAGGDAVQLIAQAHRDLHTLRLTGRANPGVGTGPARKTPRR